MPRFYRGHKIPDTDDPYELAGELMNIDNVPPDQTDESVVDFYFMKAEKLIKQWYR